MLLALGLAALGASAWFGRQAEPAARISCAAGRRSAVDYLRQGGIIGIILGGVVTYLGVLFATFTVFTAISIFGVFLGTAAPIIALSVMSGLRGRPQGARSGEPRRTS